VWLFGAESSLRTAAWHLLAATAGRKSRLLPASPPAAAAGTSPPRLEAEAREQGLLGREERLAALPARERALVEAELARQRLHGDSSFSEQLRKQREWRGLTRGRAAAAAD
jgi:hypothetical protein